MKVEIALHQAVLARLAMYGDISVVEHHGLAVLAYEGEVAPVDGCHVAVVKVDVPVGALDVN